MAQIRVRVKATRRGIHHHDVPRRAIARQIEMFKRIRLKAGKEAR